MSSLDDLFTTDLRPRTRGRCHVCGAPRSSRLTVVVARLNGNSKPIQGKSLSTSAQLCDAHAAELWAAASDLLHRPGGSAEL